MRVYFHTNSILCKRKCSKDNIKCSMNKTSTITYQFLSVPTITRLSRPMVLSRIQAVTPINSRKYIVRFDMICGNNDHYFDFIKGQNVGVLRLVRPILGPRNLQVKLQMVVLDNRRYLLTTHAAYVNIDVSVHLY